MARIRIRGIALALVLAGTQAGADTLALNDNRPETYTVVKGDTLWGISARFLRDPWNWPELWGYNPQVENPHLIYPGDVLRLVYEGGKPRLVVERPQQVESVAVAPQAKPEPMPAQPRVTPADKLSPSVRETPLAAAVPTIPLDAIRQFLDDSRIVLSAEELERAPYIVDNQERTLISAVGNRVYARTIERPDHLRYTVFRVGRPFMRQNSREVLGYEATFVGTAKLEDAGDPATLMLTRTVREALRGDRLFPATDAERLPHFVPRAPERALSGEIVAVMDGVSLVGQHQVVAIDLGANEGIEPGHVFAVFDRGETVRDSFTRAPNASVNLPDVRGGVIMVFRVFDRTSFALVMNASRPLRVHSRIGNP